MAQEIWKDIPGYEGLYQVSTLGRVRSHDKYIRCRWGTEVLRSGKVISTVFRPDGLLPDGSINGYKGATLTKDGKARYIEIHRLVALTFIPNPECKAQVNHINGVKFDNRVENLEWVTHSENMQHALRTGLKRANPEKCRAAGMCAKVKISKSVFCVTNGKTYASRRDAAKDLGIHEASVYDSLKDGRPHMGYLFVQDSSSYTADDDAVQPEGCWKDVPGYSGMYQVSTDGKVWSCERVVMRSSGRPNIVKGKLLEPSISCDGVYTITLTDVNHVPHPFFLNRLVALTFLPNPENKPEVMHLNGIKSDNCVYNLKWSTRTETQHHAIELGLTPAGSHQHMVMMSRRACELRRKVDKDEYTN